jgi:hypothetical protein
MKRINTMCSYNFYVEIDLGNNQELNSWVIEGWDLKLSATMSERDPSRNLNASHRTYQSATRGLSDGFHMIRRKELLQKLLL